MAVWATVCLGPVSSPWSSVSPWCFPRIFAFGRALIAGAENTTETEDHGEGRLGSEGITVTNLTERPPIPLPRFVCLPFSRQALRARDSSLLVELGEVSPWQHPGNRDQIIPSFPHAQLSSSPDVCWANSANRSPALRCPALWQTSTDGSPLQRRAVAHMKGRREAQQQHGPPALLVFDQFTIIARAWPASAIGGAARPRGRQDRGS